MKKPQNHDSDYYEKIKRKLKNDQQNCKSNNINKKKTTRTDKMAPFFLIFTE